MKLIFRKGLAAGLLAASAAVCASDPAVAGAAHVEGVITAPAATAGAGTGATASANAPYDWRRGPQEIALLDQATMQLPAGMAFLGRDQAQRMLRQMGNPNIENVVGIVTGTEHDWMVVLRFDKAGYVKDTDAGKWKADALLDALRQGAEQTNLQRRTEHVPEIEMLGWLEQPQYDAGAHRLTWGVAVRDKDDASADSQGLNYNTYLLGREGYFSLNLITSLQQIDRNKPHASALVAALAFRDGKRYADYDAATDKLAPYGVAALVSGSGIAKKSAGATLADAKAGAGFFARYGKLLLGIGLTLLAIATGVLGWFFWREHRATAGGEPPELSDEAAAGAAAPAEAAANAPVKE